MPTQRNPFPKLKLEYERKVTPGRRKLQRQEATPKRQKTDFEHNYTKDEPEHDNEDSTAGCSKMDTSEIIVTILDLKEASCCRGHMIVEFASTLHILLQSAPITINVSSSIFPPVEVYVMPYYVITRLALGSKYSDECDHCYLSLSQIVCISNLSAFLQNAQLLDATFSTDSGNIRSQSG